MKNFILSILFLFSFSAFSQTTHSFTTTAGNFFVEESVTVQPGDIIELSVDVYTAYGVRTSHDGVNFTTIQGGTYYPGVIFDTLIGQGNSNFYLRVENQSGIDMLTINITIDNTASISAVEEIEFNVYPNPFVDYVNIDGYVEKVSVFDLNGKLIFSDTPNSTNTKIDLSYLNSGTYILIINDRKSIKIQK